MHTVRRSEQLYPGSSTKQLNGGEMTWIYRRIRESKVAIMLWKKITRQRESRHALSDLDPDPDPSRSTCRPFDDLF